MNGKMPDDRTLYEMFEEQGKGMLPEDLLPDFEVEIHDLVGGVKESVGTLLSRNPRAYIDMDQQISIRIEGWKKSREVHMAYREYLHYVSSGNNLTNKIIAFSYFLDSDNYKKWKRIKELGLLKGSKVRLKGYGDEYTVRGITEYLSIAVDEISGKYFNPDQIL